MRGVALGAVALVAYSIRAASAEMPLPTVSFTGEAKMCISAGTEACFPSAIFYTPQRFRVESGDGETRSVGLYDVVKKTVTEIDFGEKTYSTGPFDPKSDDIGAGFLPARGDYVRVGDETSAGTRTVKYKVSVTHDKLRTEGFVWIGADHIVRRMELASTGIPNVAKVVTKFEVTKLTIGTVDPALLDVTIPSDFKKVDP